ncbi:DUF1217 domain-containing protein [Tropicimonas sp. S265A]|uniref:DUF1217 domain-containing protein n=1 Tax=Tropicimonas sp. S265A TaxID=3415134 RepID=UPI003C7DE5D2
MFEAIVPFSGVAGWQYLNATEERQREAFEKSPIRQRDLEYFRNNIASVTSVDEFVEDTRLMRVALGAFGLEADVGNRAFIKTLILEGTEESGALANRLADKRYLEFAEAFTVKKVSGGAPFTSDDIEEVVTGFLELKFEASVGTSDENLRIALQLEREIADISRSVKSEDAQYFTILGSPPLRLAFEKAFGLPESFSSIDIDKQVEVLKGAVADRFGSSSLSIFEDQERTSDLIQLYLVRATAGEYNGSVASAQTALRLLTS